MFSKYGKEMNENGILCIPMSQSNPKKKPHYPKCGYKQFTRDNYPSDEILSKWDSEFKNDITNIIILGDAVPAIDFDIPNEDIANQLKDYLREEFSSDYLFFRYGTRPKFLVPFRRGDEFSKIQSNTYQSPNGDTHTIEAMGSKTSYTYYGFHRKTGKEYEEENSKDKKLREVTLSRLPKLSKSDILKLFEFYQSIIPDDWSLLRLGTKDKPIMPEDKVGEIHEYTPDELESYLMKIPYEDYVQWTSVGMALHDYFEGTKRGLNNWIEWSREACEDVFDESEIEYKWSIFKTDIDERIKSNYIINQYVKYNGHEVKDNILNCNTMVEAIDRFFFVSATGKIFDSKIAGECGYYASKVDPIIDKQTFLDLYKNVNIVRKITKTSYGKSKIVEDSQSLGTRWLNSKNRRTIANTIYAPNKPKLFTTEHHDCNVTFGNVFVDNKIEEVKERDLVRYYTQHIEYLIPNKEESKWFVQWMAWCLRNKGERCKVTPLLINTDQGSGRGWVVKLIYKLFGEWNCSATDMQQISEGFHDYMIDKLMVCIEEVHQNKGRYEISDTLKSILDGDTFHGNIKYGAMSNMRKFANFFFMSNRLDALPLENDDRRINVFYGKTRKKTQSYYDFIYDLVDNNKTFLKQVYSYLMNSVDLSDFNPKGRSMMTEGRDLLMRANKNDSQILIEKFVSETKAKMITQEMVEELLSEISETTMQYNKPALDKMIMTITGKSVTMGFISGVLVKYWQIEDFEDLIEVEYKIAKKELRKFLSGGVPSLGLSTEDSDKITNISFSDTEIDLSQL